MKKERVLIDTNIIIDVFAHREGFYHDSYRLLKLCESGDVFGYITASSATDIYCLVRKYCDKKTADEALGHLLAFLSVIDVTGEDVITAHGVHAEDFEDCLIGTCAKKAGITRIITRDKKGFSSAEIPFVTAEEYVNNRAK